MKVDFRRDCPIHLFPIIWVLDEFSDNNYIVGGAVRDLLMNKVPHDYDLVTDIPMERLIELFEDGGFSVSLTGVAHFVLNVHFSGYTVEVSNFRKDFNCDGRHAEVEVGTIHDDAHRRDFTVNALYINTKTQEVVDPTGMGMDDINSRTLRFVGKPKDRIKEDALRVVRLYRFVSKGFEPEPKSLRACREMFNDAYNRLAPERVRVEIEKMANIQGK